MIGLIRKRHEGPAWVVVTELANGTGATAHRRADAVAIGLWPSHGYKIIGYECKASRGDVQKELKDPQKADAIGKFCDEWWLVIDDVKIIDGLVLPETWGVLAPKNQVLRVVKKAPKLTPAPVDRGFVAAIVRKVTESWVPRMDHNALREELHQKIEEKVRERREADREDHAHEVKALKQTIAAFEERSGVQINRYNGPNIGDAVKIVMNSRDVFGQEALKRNIRQLDGTAQQHEWTAQRAREAARQLTTLVVDDKQAELPFHDVSKAAPPPAADDLQTVRPGAVIGPRA